MNETAEMLVEISQSLTGTYQLDQCESPWQQYSRCIKSAETLVKFRDISVAPGLAIHAEVKGNSM